MDAGVAAVCMAMTAATVAESRDPSRSHSIDFGGSLLVALTLAPFVLAVSKGSDWGWTSAATLGCLALCRGRGIPLRRGGDAGSPSRCSTWPCCATGSWSTSTIAILIGAGTINALMYLVSLYFQDPSDPRAQPVAGRPGDPAGHRGPGG